jgi:hypothetical protein
MPLTTINNTTSEVLGGIHPPSDIAPIQQATGGIPGEIYFAIVILAITTIACMVILHLIVAIWGSPVLKAASSRTSGNAIIQQFQNSKIGSLLLAPISCGAIRHAKVSDGTLITTPHGINNLSGHSFVNSWNLLGISIPTFLMGGISRLREKGIYTRDQLIYLTTPQLNKDTQAPEIILNPYDNLITDSYNFNIFTDILEKSKTPNYINLQIEHTGDFINSVNQHYTESEITKEVQSYLMTIKNTFGNTIIITAIAVFIVALAMYMLGV